MAAAGDTISSPRSGGRGGCQCHLPEELAAEVLNRLPLTPCLLRFRCVSKSWHRLLSDIPNFIRRRILFNDDDDDDEKNARIMVARRAEKSDYPSVRFTALFSDTLRPVSTHSCAPFTSPTLAGCRNGILCIHDSPDFPCPAETRIALWNPATTESKFAPSLPTPPGSNCATVGFGFDPNTNDYKTLLIFSNQERGGRGGGRISAWVYSLRKNSWTQIETHGVNRPIHGLCYRVEEGHSSSSSIPPEKTHLWRIDDYIAGEEDHYVTVVSFDVSKQVFETVRSRLPCPTYVRSISMVKEESLVVVFSDIRREQKFDDYEVWVVLDHRRFDDNERDRWVKLLAVSFDLGVCRAIIPGFWKQGKGFMVDGNGGLCLADLETGRCCDGGGQLEVEGEGNVLQVVMAYVPSMVSLCT